MRNAIVNSAVILSIGRVCLEDITLAMQLTDEGYRVSIASREFSSEQKKFCQKIGISLLNSFSNISVQLKFTVIIARSKSQLRKFWFKRFLRNEFWWAPLGGGSFKISGVRVNPGHRPVSHVDSFICYSILFECLAQLQLDVVFDKTRLIDDPVGFLLSVEKDLANQLLEAFRPDGFNVDQRSKRVFICLTNPNDYRTENDFFENLANAKLIAKSRGFNHVLISEHPLCQKSFDESIDPIYALMHSALLISDCSSILYSAIEHGVADVMLMPYRPKVERVIADESMGWFIFKGVPVHECSI